MGNTGGKTLLRRPRRKFLDNINIDVQDVGSGSMDRIDLTRDRDRWRQL